MIEQETVNAKKPAQDPDEPLMVVEVMPEFPGGRAAMTAYISTELKYPEEAVENGQEGSVFLGFVVERDGSISEVEVLRGIGYGCDEEAVRVLKGMPKWTPGNQGGMVVRTRYKRPIRFKLQNKEAPRQ